jgi:hypothetical protein
MLPGQTYIMIPMGTTSGVINVKIKSDTTVEGDDEATVTLTALQAVTGPLGSLAVSAVAAEKAVKIVIQNDD